MYRVRLLLAWLVLLLIVAVPFAYRAYVSTKYRNLRVVKQGKLYRSGQMSPAGFERVCREYGIGTVVTLREQKADGKYDDEEFEQRFCANNKIAFHRFPQCEWTRTGKHQYCATTLDSFLAILRDPKTEFPILIHCFAGIHRTGAHVAMYRMEVDGWTPQQAIAELQSMGTVRTKFDNDLLTFLGSYTPQKHQR